MRRPVERWHRQRPRHRTSRHWQAARHHLVVSVIQRIQPYGLPGVYCEIRNRRRFAATVEQVEVCRRSVRNGLRCRSCVIHAEVEVIAASARRRVGHCGGEGARRVQAQHAPTVQH